MDRYKNLVKLIARKYYFITGEFNDIIQEGMIGLFNAYNKFDESKNVQFKTFASLCINRQILTAIKKFNKVCSFKAEVTENKYDIEFM